MQLETLEDRTVPASLFGGLLGNTLSTVSSQVSTLGNTLTTLTSTLNTLNTSTSPASNNPVQTVVNTPAPTNTASNPLSTVTNTLGTLSTTVGNTVSTVGNTVNTLGTTVSTLGNTLTSLTNTLNTVSTASPVGNTVGTLGSTLTTLTNTIGALTNTLTNTLTSTVSSVGNTLTNTVSTLTASLGNTLSSTLGPLGNTLGSLLTSTVAALTNTLGATLSTLNSTVNTLTSTLTTLTGTVGTLGNTLTGTVNTLGNTLTSTVSTPSPAGSVQNTITSLTNTVNTLGSTATAVDSAVSTLGTTVGILSDTLTTLNNTLSTVTTASNVAGPASTSGTALPLVDSSADAPNSGGSQPSGHLSGTTVAGAQPGIVAPLVTQLVQIQGPDLSNLARSGIVTSGPDNQAALSPRSSPPPVVPSYPLDLGSGRASYSGEDNVGGDRATTYGASGALPAQHGRDQADFEPSGGIQDETPLDDVLLPLALGLPDERQFLLSTDLARALLTGARPQANLVAQKDTNLALVPTVSAGTASGPVALNDGASEQTQTRATEFMINPISGSLAVQPVTRRSGRKQAIGGMTSDGIRSPHAQSLRREAAGQGTRNNLPEDDRTAVEETAPASSAPTSQVPQGLFAALLTFELCGMFWAAQTRVNRKRAVQTAVNLPFADKDSQDPSDR